MKNRTRHLSATRAAREFSALLDQVEAGADFVIERHRRVVAVIAPAAVAPRRISACVAIALAHPSVAPDAEFAADLARIVAEHSSSHPPAWE